MVHAAFATLRAVEERNGHLHATIHQDKKGAYRYVTPRRVGLGDVKRLLKRTWSNYKTTSTTPEAQAC